MLGLLIAAAALLGSITEALIIRNQPKGTTIDDNYDTLPPSIALGQPQIGEYNGLEYIGWAVAGSALLGGGLEVHSPKQGAVAVTTLTPAGNPGSISVSPKLKSFDLISFYFGCVVVGVGGQASIPDGCAISVSGFRGNTLVGEQAFDFGQPQSPLAAPMLFADLRSNPNYKGLTNVTIARATPPGTLLIIDDLVHTNYPH